MLATINSQEHLMSYLCRLNKVVLSLDIGDLSGLGLCINCYMRPLEMVFFVGLKYQLSVTYLANFKLIQAERMRVRGFSTAGCIAS